MVNVVSDWEMRRLIKVNVYVRRKAEIVGIIQPATYST